MRLLTFSFLKSCKFKIFYRQLPPRDYSVLQQEATARKFIGDPSLVEIAPTWKESEDSETRAMVLHDMQVLPDFVSEKEETSLLAELEPYLKRMRYEFDHWDNAIQGYRETERGKWLPENQAVLDRVKMVAFTDDSAGEPLPHTHILDLAAAGFIKPHVDAVRFCGEVIAGVSLVSGAVMRLQSCTAEHHVVLSSLPRRSLYIMRGVARYSFTHAVLGGEESVWRGVKIPRQRRIAVITRSKPKPAS